MYSTLIRNAYCYTVPCTCRPKNTVMINACSSMVPEYLSFMQTSTSETVQTADKGWIWTAHRWNGRQNDCTVMPLSILIRQNNRKQASGPTLLSAVYLPISWCACLNRRNDSLKPRLLECNLSSFSWASGVPVYTDMTAVSFECEPSVGNWPSTRTIKQF